MTQLGDDSLRSGPYGVAPGHCLERAPSSCNASREDRTLLGDDDLLVAVVCGGGGYGDPVRRDIVSRDFLEDPAAAPLFEFTAARGIRWQLGTNDPPGFLAAHGWQAEVNAFAAVARRLGRWPLPGASEDVADRTVGKGGSYFISSERAALQP